MTSTPRNNLLDRASADGRTEIEVVYGDPLVMERCELLPPEEFHADGETPTDRRWLRARFGVSEEDTGPNSQAVRARFASCTSGWPVPPSSEELYNALRAKTPSSRQRTVISAWLTEATFGEIALAWLQEAYSWKDLVSAARHIDYRCNVLSRYLNQFSK